MRVPYNKIKDEVLGKEYDLSLAFLSAEEMREVMRYKQPRRPVRVGAPTKASGKRNKISNVLSFPLSKTSGEILICKKAAPPFTVGYLFIHGLFHLKGFKHGATMEKQERRILKRFDLGMHEQNRNRN